MCEKNTCYITNVLLKVLIVIIITVIGVIIWRGFERLQNEIFGIKVVLAEVGGYIKESK